MGPFLRESNLIPPPIPPALPPPRGLHWDAEVERERDMEAEGRRQQRRGAYRRSTARVVISVAFDAFFGYGFVVNPGLWTSALLLFSLGATAWTIRDTIRARREFASPP